MTLRRSDFAAFFAALHDGHEPYGWQERLLDELLETGAWPERIVAPTGAGKTAVIDVHIFAVALSAGLGGPRPPRRLAMVVGRRVLVDDQYEHAERVAAALENPGDTTLAEVAERLRELRRPSDGSVTSGEASPLVVARLRGGTRPSREWRDHPTACAVVCGTPDMWGSRVLFRGYGSARRAWPREAGLLALDAAVVVDEAHLSRQLLTTARRVAQLVSVAEEPVPVPGLQVIETTATPGGGAGAGDRSVGVTEVDLTTEPTLSDRLTRPKPVTLVPEKDWPTATKAQRRRVADRMADETVELLTPPAPGEPADTVGCYVNTVGMAVEVTKALRERRRPDGAPVRVVTVCGQARPADLERLRRDHPGVLTVAGNPDVDVLVATQSLEVGVDLDLAAVVTELAPGSALVQRAGRVNRRGLRQTAQVRVVIPARKLTDRSRSGPYGPGELSEALDWVERRATDPAGMAPWALRDDPPPQAASRRILLQRPEIADVWHWARTNDELAAEPQLDLWLAESFDEEGSVGLAVRDAMPADAAAAVSLVRLIPPQDREVFTVPPGTARALVTEAVRGVEGDDPAERPLVVRVRGDDVTVVDPDRIEIDPGDVVVVDSGAAVFTPSTSNTASGFSPPVPVVSDENATDPATRTTADDVLHEVAAPSAGQVVLRLEPGAWPTSGSVRGLLKEYADLADGASERPRREGLRRLLERFLADLGEGSRTPMVRAAIDLMREPVRNSDLVLHRDDQGAPARLVLVDRRRAWTDERLRQTWLPSDSPVLLDDHQRAVAERAGWIGQSLRLPGPLVDALKTAGRHHDDGKADPRFQAGLGAADELLAKSGGLPFAESRRLADQAGLPRQWRHEQRSVVASWASVHAAVPPAYAQLVARLVGTSHGHGRVGFPHTAIELLTADDSDADRHLAEDLFNLGAWDNLIESTHRRWGVWACAYLEALLRAADGQVSAEGR